VRRLVLLVLLLLCPALASAQPIHNYPGKSAYASPAEWPAIDAQCHWVPGDGSPAIDPPNTLTHDMAHTHVAVKAPIYAELKGPITVSVPIKLFHTAGKITDVWALFAGPCGQQSIGISLDKPLPLVGDPNGLVTATGTMTFDPNKGLGVCLPKHGWFSVLVNVRTIYTNKDQLDVTNTTSYYSTIDLTQPEAPLNEAGIAVSGKCQNVSSHSSTVNNVYGIQLVEFRKLLPLLTPITKAVTIENFSYAYGYDHALPTGSYELDLDPDLHMGLAGKPLTFKANAATGGTFNQDVIDPWVLAASTAPMGYPAKTHKLLFAWVQPTGTAPIIGHDGGTIAPNVLLKTLIAFDVVADPGGTPPPQLCTDPTATNNGGPLPCIYPTPPPPPCGPGGTFNVPALGFTFLMTVKPDCTATAVKQ